MGARLFFGVFLFFLSTAPVSAETLNVAFSHWPPWKIHNTKDPNGIDARILKELGQRTGIDFHFLHCPWPRCIAFIKDGQADLITSFGKTEERQGYSYFLGEPYFVDSVTFWVERGSGVEISQYTDLARLSVGFTKGAAYFTKFDQDTTLEKVAVNHEEQLFKMLKSGRIDTFIGYETVVRYKLAQRNLTDQFRSTPLRYTGGTYHLGMSKKSSHLILQQRLAEELAKMREEGEIAQIIDQVINETSQCSAKK